MSGLDTERNISLELTLVRNGNMFMVESGSINDDGTKTELTNRDLNDTDYYQIRTQYKKVSLLNPSPKFQIQIDLKPPTVKKSFMGFGKVIGSTGTLSQVTLIFKDILPRDTTIAVTNQNPNDVLFIIDYTVSATRFSPEMKLNYGFKVCSESVIVVTVPNNRYLKDNNRSYFEEPSANASKNEEGQCGAGTLGIYDPTFLLENIKDLPKL